MIVDIILLALSGAYAAHGIKNFVEQNREVPQLPKKVEEPISDTVELIGELLREGKGWTRSATFGFDRYDHTSGVCVKKQEYQGYHYSLDVYVSIYDNEGQSKSVSITQAEENFLGAELAKFDTSRANAEQEELARILANRVVSGTSVRPILGDASGTSSNATSEMAIGGRLVRDPISTNYIHFSDGQITYEKPKDFGEVFLSTALARRYGLRGTMPERQIR